MTPISLGSFLGPSLRRGLLAAGGALFYSSAAERGRCLLSGEVLLSVWLGVGNPRCDYCFSRESSIPRFALSIAQSLHS